MTAHTPSRDILPSLQRSAREALSPIQREINRMFDQLGDGWDSFPAFRLAPSMDMVETKSGVEITMELPGMSRGDVKIAMDGDQLTVSGEKKSEHESKDHTRRVTERSYGAFARSITLPHSVDGAKITATMKDGVLTIAAPKRADAEPKTIEIQSA